MPDTPTSRLALYKSASDGSEDVDYTQDIGNNWDALDLAVGALACTSSTRPSVPWDGQLIRETDTDRLWVSNASSPASGSWSEICTPGTSQIFTAGIGAEVGAAATNAIVAYVTDDTANRFTVGGDGRIWWGSGSATLDTNLYRSAANILKTDDSLTVGTNLSVAGSGSITGNLAVAGDFAVTGVGGILVKVKSADTSRSSTITTTADPHINFTLAASATYILDGFLYYSAGSAGDFQVAWSIPTGASGQWLGNGVGTSVASATSAGGTTTDNATSWGYTLRAESTAMNAARAYGGIDTSTAFGVQLVGTVHSGSGGTFALAWAQNSSSATATKLYTDSWVRLQRVA